MAEFQEWAKKLRGGDGDALDALDLPSVSAIKAVGVEGKVYGFIRVAKKARIEQLFADPLVRSVRIADVGFDLDQNSIP